MKMLLRCIRLCVSMFIVLAFCQELTSNELIRILPDGEEFIMKEGESLLIKYKTDTRLNFVYPLLHEKLINYSNYYIRHVMKNGLYYYEFERPYTVFGDTGWYGCANHNFDSSTNSSDTVMDWLYVYVNSDTNLFVEANTDIIHLNAVAGDNIVIPCRITLPDLKPILINSNKDELSEVPFDPKIGFIIRNLSLGDSNSYKCLIEKDGKVHSSVSYVLSVLKEAISEPKIQANLPVRRGQDLEINCTINMKLSMEHEFDWNIPQQNNSRRITQHFIKYLDGNTVLVTSQLTIFDVTDEDSGDYECVVRSINDVKKTMKYIKIFDPPQIELIPEFNSSYFRRTTGSSIIWTIYVIADSETYLQWLKPNGKEIVGKTNDIIIFEYVEDSILGNYEIFTLEITLLNITDSGIYTVQAKNDYAIKRINITLDVTDKPISILMPIESYYLSNDDTEFRCEVISNPPPNIKWSFLKCPNFPSLEYSTIVHLTNVTQSANSNYKYQSIVKMPVDISGKITCEACNDLGCNSKTENIIVSDPVPPFFVETNMNETKTNVIDAIAESHNTVILQCITDGKPKPTVTWYKDNILLKESDQYFFKNNQQELQIKYLMLQDSGRYLCRANNSMGINETYQLIMVKNTKWHILDTVLITSLSILGFILIILAISFAIKIHREKKVKKELMGAGLINFEEGALECLNPNLRVNDQAELLPYDKKWEFPRDRLKLREQLGSGQFGVVMKAEAIGIYKNENISTVAVKTVRRTANPIYIRALVSELKIMVHLGKHLNIVNLLGACTKNIFKCELLVIVEYCHFGNLRNYLLRHRNNFIDQTDSKTGKFDFTICTDTLTRIINVNNDSLNENSNMVVHYYPRKNSNSPQINFLPDCVLNSDTCQPGERSNYYDKDQNLKPICTQDLLSWAFQVARGMEYLSQRKVLHGDLAARNILLTEDNIVKICDFGLAKNIYKYGNYKKKSDVPMPIKWMAIESIRDRIFSTQSDVWSFGIMLWEFFTLAKTPYPDMEIEEQYQKLIEGYRLEQPDYAVDEIYDIMLQCWIAKSTLRPSFTNLVESIGNLLEESVRMHYIILNNPYIDINNMNMNNGKSDYLMMMSTPDHVVPSYLDNNRINTSLSNDTSDLLHLGMRPDCPMIDSGIFSPRSPQDHSEISLSMPVSKHAAEFPILKHEEDLYLKPINVQERRAEFARKRQTIKNQIIDKSIHQNSVYCNAPRNSLEVERYERE